MDYYGEDSDPDDDAVQAAHQLRSLAGEFWTRRLSCLLVLRNRRIPCGAPLSAGRVGKTSFFSDSYEGEAAVQRAREAGDAEARQVRGAWQDQGMLSWVFPSFRSAPQVSAGDALRALMKEAAQHRPACRPCRNTTPCRPGEVGRRRESSLQGARCSLPAESVTSMKSYCSLMLFFLLLQSAFAQCGTKLRKRQKEWLPSCKQRMHVYSNSLPCGELES